MTWLRVGAGGGTYSAPKMALMSKALTLCSLVDSSPRLCGVRSDLVLRYLFLVFCKVVSGKDKNIRKGKGV